MTLVLDASVGAQLVVPEAFSTESDALFNDAVRAGRPVIGPPLLPVEVTNVIRKRMRADRVLLPEALTVLDTFLALPITLVSPPNLHRQALSPAAAYGLGVHDAHYVALAQVMNGVLWVDDVHMLRAIGGRLPFVRSIRDYAPGAGTT